MLRGHADRRRTVVVGKSHSLATHLHFAERDLKQEQHAAAQLYCEVKNCGAKQALIDNPGWTAISKDSLHKRLKGLVKCGKEHEGSGILTGKERAELASAMEAAGKCGHGFDKDARNDAVVDILTYRVKQNLKGGRRHVPLSIAAKLVLTTGFAGKAFWKAFFAEFKNMLHLTKEKVTSIQRLKQCTTATASRHVDELIELLTAKGIYDPINECIIPGKEANLIWEDEMGQFFNFGLLKGQASNVVGAVGFEAKSADAENRQQFSYDGAIGGDLFLYDPHLIFRADSFLADMAPPCLADWPHSMISVTEKGCQTGITFLARQKCILAQARSRGVRGDIVFITDGHASRFSVEVLRWLDKSKEEDEFCVDGNDMYITPPNATGTCCVLDQFFQSLHRGYGKEVKVQKKVEGIEFSVSRWEAIQFMCHIHPTWCTVAEKHRAFRVCGLSMDGLREGLDKGKSTISINHFPVKNFWADALLAPPSPVVVASPIATESSFESSFEAPTPSPSLGKDTKGNPKPNPNYCFLNYCFRAEYFKRKAELTQIALDEAIKALHEAEASRKEHLLVSPSPLEGGVIKTTFKLAKKKDHMEKNFRVTQVQGSLMGSALLELRESGERCNVLKKQEKDDEIESRRLAYEKCRHGCKCDDTLCAAGGLYLCRYCNTYKKKICGVAACKEKYEQEKCTDKPLPKGTKNRPSKNVLLALKDVTSDEESMSEEEVEEGQQTYKRGDHNPNP